MAHRPVSADVLPFRHLETGPHPDPDAAAVAPRLTRLIPTTVTASATIAGISRIVDHFPTNVPSRWTVVGSCRAPGGHPQSRLL